MATGIVSEGLCQICDAVSTERCSGCDDGPFYCTKLHQLEDWRGEHGPKCPGVKKVTDPTDGSMSYVAKRPLEANRVVFKRSPIVVFPRQLYKKDLCTITNAGEFEKVFGADAYKVMVPCLGCCQIISYNMVMHDPIRGYCRNSCTRCFWPVHDRDCELSMRHKDECMFLRYRNIHMRWGPRVFYWIGYLRAYFLMKANHPDWDILMKMPYNSAIVTPKHREESRKFFFGICGLGHLISCEELDKLIDICHSNFLTCNHEFHSGRARLAYIIYNDFQGRVLSYSCMPNCHAYIDKDNFEVTFRTIRPVKVGETLTIDYNPECPSFLGLGDRMRRLPAMNLPIPCKCLRCSDCTENGTYYSAQKCTHKKCKVGWRTPYLDDKGLWTWICEICDKLFRKYSPLLEPQVRHIVSKVQLQIQNGERDIVKRKGVLDKMGPKFFHPNHYFIHMTETNIALEGMKIISEPTQYFLPNWKLNLGAFNHHSPRMFEHFNRVIELNQLLKPGTDLPTAELIFYRYLLLISMLTKDVFGWGKKAKLSDQTDRVKLILEGISNSLDILEFDPLKEETRDRDGRKFTLRLHTMALNEAILRSGDPTGSSLPYFNELIHKWESIPDGPNTPKIPAGLSLKDELKFLADQYALEKDAWIYFDFDWHTFLRNQNHY